MKLNLKRGLKLFTSIFSLLSIIAVIIITIFYKIVGKEIFFIKIFATYFEFVFIIIFILLILSLVLTYLFMKNFTVSIIDSIPDNIAIVDKDGVITYINHNWVEFALNNGLDPGECCEGINYLKVCEEATGPYSENTTMIAQKIREVIKGEREKFEWEYPCHSPDKDRWFLMKVLPISNKFPSQVLIIHINITERRKKEIELSHAYQKLDRNFEQASKLHQYFLPDDLPQIEELSMVAYYQPAEKLGGDFYNIEQFSNKLLFYLADVSGHGLDGAMLNILVRENIDRFTSRKKEVITPRKVMKHILNRYNQEGFPEDYFLCLQIGIIDLNNMQLDYSNAGFHVLPFIISNKGEVSSLSVSGFPISTAIETGKLEFHQDNYKLRPGDKLMFTTDGLIEEMKAGRIYGEKRLINILKENYFLPSEILLDLIKRDFNNFKKESNNQDDITILIMERKVEKRLEREIPSDLQKMYEIEEEIDEFLNSNVHNVDKDKLKIGLNETLINAIEHGNKFADDKKVNVKVVSTDTYIRILIKDEGKGFNWQQIMGKINEEESVEVVEKMISNFQSEIFTWEKSLVKRKERKDFNERGRGLILTNQIYDQVVYNSKGNKVCLVKFV